jgi:hypothetical protein
LFGHLGSFSSRSDPVECAVAAYHMCCTRKPRG